MKLRFVFFLLSFFFLLTLEAQCAMCRAVLESGEEQATAEGINNGIVYLMVIPYILIAGVGYFIYRSFNKASKEKKIP
jgi:heme/copper-type cytochrome/quinol oxidase subunit 2